MTTTDARTGLHVLASAAATPDQADEAPALTGFIESRFNPLVHRVAWRCLTGRATAGDRTAVVLASLLGDTTTADLASRQLAAGRAHNAILFMQATANAILGHVSQEFDLTGPLLSLSTRDPAADLLGTAELLLDDGDVDQVLLIGIELAASERATAACAELAVPPPTEDLAVAALVTRGTAPTRDELRRLFEPNPADHRLPGAEQ